MTWRFHPIVLLYFAAAALAFVLLVLTRRRQPARSGSLWCLTLAACVLWAGLEGLLLMVTGLDWKLALTRLEYLGIIGTPVGWSLFVISYSHYDRWLNRTTTGLMLVVPVISYLVILTLPHHTLWYRSVGLMERSGVVLLDKVYGPAFWVFSSYIYLIVIGGAVILFQAVLRFPELFRGQITLLVLAALTPLASNFLYISGHNPIAPFDPSPLAFVLSGLLITWSMQRYQFLDVMPVAHDLVFRNVQSGVIVIDTRGAIMDMNPAAERILGCSQNEVAGKLASEAFPQHQGLLERFRNVMQAASKITLNKRVYELQITPLTDRAGQQAGRIIMLYDVTEREQALEELDAYAHTVAHDLKNPLTVLVGYAGLVERNVGNPVPDNLRLPLEAIRESSFKMQSIIDELLILASVREEDQITLAPLDTDAIVYGAISRLLRVIQEHAADIQVPDTWPVAAGYAPWVEEIWANYISNAIKYGGRPPRVELGADLLPPASDGAGVTVQQDQMVQQDHLVQQDQMVQKDQMVQQGRVRFWVRDNGEGLTPEEQGQLFVAFSRLDQRQEAEGHGLGLSIVQRIVERLGGTAGVESQPGEGSTFYFTLPAASEPVDTGSAVHHPSLSSE